MINGKIDEKSQENGSIVIFKEHYRHLGLKHRFTKAVELAIKCAIMLVMPIPFVVGILFFWYYALYQRGIYFNQGLEGIIAAAWIPTFGILYSLLTAVVLSTVWSEYKTMRTAVKKYDVETFIDLRDEEMSPLVHVMMIVLSLAVLAAFMGIKYPDVWSGTLLISSTAYLFVLIFLVIIEIDDPCSGLWFIKNIHKEWLEINPKEWRKQRSEDARAAFHQKKNNNHNGASL
ncbi:MAG: hypothetical protein WC246_00710 [Candidatus Paceibacterota bacterium]|jgi:hypothetical protein